MEMSTLKIIPVATITAIFTFLSSTIMVRIKHRYLLVNILYPESAQNASAKKASNHVVNIHRPSPDAVTPSLLARMLRECIAHMFGDWGMGKLGGATAWNVNGTTLSLVRSFQASLILLRSLTSRRENPSSSHELRVLLVQQSNISLQQRRQR